MGQLVVGHYNHGWRGDESDQDAEFVEHLSRDLGVVFVRADAPAAEQPLSEEAARDARYEFLVQMAHRVGARFLVTAHTADDQIETVLHRIIRGSSVSGISGIPRTRQLSESLTLLRPLLPFRRGSWCLFG